MPLTLGEFLVIHALATVVLSTFSVGAWLVARRIGQTPSRRFSTSIALPLHTAGFFAGGFVYWLMTPKAEYQTILMFAVFGGLIGVNSGNLIGWFLWRHYRKEIEGDQEPLP